MRVERQSERRREIDSCFRYFCDWWIMEVFFLSGFRWLTGCLGLKEQGWRKKVLWFPFLTQGLKEKLLLEGNQQRDQGPGPKWGLNNMKLSQQVLVPDE